MIASGEVDPIYPVDTYLVHPFRQDLVGALFKDALPGFCSPCMMWPLAQFYNGSNDLDADELRLEAIFRERGREDLANCVIDGRKAQRYFFVLGPESSFLDSRTLHIYSRDSSGPSTSKTSGISGRTRPSRNGKMIAYSVACWNQHKTSMNKEKERVYKERVAICGVSMYVIYRLPRCQ